MKTIISVIAVLSVSLIVGLLSAGCATTKEVDWASRIGVWTYDQAVLEMGPPAKQSKLSDGRIVAEWITGRAARPSLSFGVGSAGSHTAFGVGQSVGGGYNDRVLRLTFGQDGKLENWTRNY